MCLRDTGTDKHNVHDVVVVDGFIQIPVMQIMIKEFFNGKELINPDEEVAFSAAWQAVILTGEVPSQVQALLLWNVTQMSMCLGHKVGS